MAWNVYPPPTFANLLASLLSCGRYTLHALPRHVCPESLASTYRPRWRCATCHTAYITKAFRINRIRHPHPLRPFILSLSCPGWWNGNLVEPAQNRSSNRDNALHSKKNRRSFLSSFFNILTWDSFEKESNRNEKMSCWKERGIVKTDFFNNNSLFIRFSFPLVHFLVYQCNAIYIIATLKLLPIVEKKFFN